MDRKQATDDIRAAKLARNISWKEIAEKTSMSTEFIVSACLGMNHMEKEDADAVVEFLNLPNEVSIMLQQFPNKKWEQTIPTDPLLYRLYEMVGVYGETIKELIHEEFGDGIMSAIDFKMDLSKEESNEGDRVKLNLSGKFLKYRSW